LLFVFFLDCYKKNAFELSISVNMTHVFYFIFLTPHKNKAYLKFEMKI
jgi:hypothetical protein